MNLKRFLKPVLKYSAIVLIPVVVFILLFVLWFFVPWRNYLPSAINSKNHLAAQISLFATPPSCHEIKRTYQAPFYDAMQEWKITYTCNTSGDIAHNAIVADLKMHGYSETDPVYPGSPAPAGAISSIQDNGQGATYIFDFDSASYSAGYEFVTPPTNSSFQAATVDQLSRVSVRTITLTLSPKN